MLQWSRITAATTAGCVAALIAGGTALADEIAVLSTAGPMPDVMGTLAPMFERASGHKLTISFKAAPAIATALKEGGVDVVIAGTQFVDDYAKSGLLAAGNEIGNTFTISKVGVAVRAGAAKPAIDTPEKLKAALLAAKTVGYSQGTSGQHFLSVIERLGIADAVKAKAVIAQGEPVGARVARGEAEIGVQQVAELLPVAGIDFVGPLPGDLQKPIPYSVGIAAKAKNPEAAKALMLFLASAEAQAVLKRKGMDPAQ